MQAGPQVCDRFKERDVTGGERPSGVWTGEIVHISHYGAGRS